MPRKLTSPKQLSAKEAFALLAEYADAGAHWWLQSWIELEGRVHGAELIIARPGQELGRWPVHAMSIGRLIRQRVLGTAEALALPHVDDLSYEDEEQLAWLVKMGVRLRSELPGDLNRLVRRRYLLEDAGPLSAEAEAWCSEARAIEEAVNWDKLCEMLRLVGSMRYKYHSSQLAPYVVWAGLAETRVKTWLDKPYPGPANADRMIDVAVPRRDRRWYTDNLYYRDGLVPCDPGPLFEEGLAQRVFRRGAILASEQEEPEPEAPVKRGLTKSEVRAQLLAMREQLDSLLEKL